MADSWDIQHDFFQPACNLLDGAKTNSLASKLVAMFLPDSGLACTWLDVHVSVAVGDRVRGLLHDVVERRSGAAERALTYLRDLSLVLLQREHGTPIPRGEIPPEKLSRHYSPSELARVIGKSWDTVKKLLESGAIRHVKHSTKDYQIHVDYLPDKHHQVRRSTP